MRERDGRERERCCVGVERQLKCLAFSSNLHKFVVLAEFANSQIPEILCASSAFAVCKLSFIFTFSLSRAINDKPLTLFT